MIKDARSQRKGTTIFPVRNGSAVVAKPRSFVAHCQRRAAPIDKYSPDAALQHLRAFVTIDCCGADGAAARVFFFLLHLHYYYHYYRPRYTSSDMLLRFTRRVGPNATRQRLDERGALFGFLFFSSRCFDLSFFTSIAGLLNFGFS